MIEAAYKYNRIVQHGVQLRSSPAIREAVQHLQNGLIGRVYMSTRFGIPVACRYR
jgi:predicted dehydrogenase